MIYLELLERHPAALKEVISFFTERFIQSLDNPKVPDDFKEYAREHVLSKEYIAEIVSLTPHTLFEFFDKKSILISIVAEEADLFSYSIKDIITNDALYENRMGAEEAAVREALRILEEQLLIVPAE